MPSALRCCGLVDHINDLNSILQRGNSYNDLHAALSSMQGDGISQIMSFMTRDAALRSCCTLSAVSPQMRLDAEGLIRRLVKTAKVMARAQVEENCLVYRVSATELADAPSRVADSLWWAIRCGLPVVVHVNDARTDVLAAFSNNLRSRVAELRVDVTENKIELCSAGPTCAAACGRFLSALSTFPNLEKLFVMCKAFPESGLTATRVKRALGVAAQMPIQDTTLCNLSSLSDFCALSGARCLRRLTLSQCGVQNFVGLSSLPKLAELDVSGSSLLSTLNGVFSLPLLQIFTATKCALRNVDTLHACPQLREVDVSENEVLVDLRGLSGAPSLTKLTAKECGLRTLDGLNQCLCLTEVDVSYNFDLEDVEGLAGAPRLERLTAGECQLRSLAGLGSCPRLKEVNVCGNEFLSDVSALAGSSSLQYLNLWGCNATDTRVLSTAVQIGRE